MILKKLILENFRNHQKRIFTFPPTTLIIGRNTAGKSNIIESIYLLSHGTSFRGEKDYETIRWENEFAKVTGIFDEAGDKKELTVVLSIVQGRFSKKFLVNSVAKRGVDFVSQLYSVLFTPQDIEIITESPSFRRNYVDSVLQQSSREYRVAVTIYEKALRHRNRMLHDLRDGKKYYKTTDFEYWDNLLIENGNSITEFRHEFVEFVNATKKEIFNFEMEYDKSLINEVRLEKYYHEERAAGITLVGPQRDDFFFYYPTSKKMIREYGSRGEQRLTVLQLKLFEIEFLKQKTGQIPTLLLDDIFSELDSINIGKVFKLTRAEQTIITTTHKEFIPKEILKGKDIEMIEL